MVQVSLFGAASVRRDKPWMMGGWLLWIGDEGCSPIRVVYDPKGPILLDVLHCSYAVLGLLL